MILDPRDILRDGIDRGCWQRENRIEREASETSVPELCDQKTHSILLSLFPCDPLLGGSLSPIADHFPNTWFVKPYTSLGLLMEVS